MSQLAFRYEYAAGAGDPKNAWGDYGRLSMSVSTNDFSGKGGFSTVLWQDIKAFEEKLTTFPITKNVPVAAQWGDGLQEGENLILRIEIAPNDSLGGLIVRCEVADEGETGEPVRGRVRAWFVTSYADLDTFRQSIGSMLNHEVDEAVLIGL